MSDVRKPIKVQIGENSDWLNLDVTENEREKIVELITLYAQSHTHSELVSVCEGYSNEEYYGNWKQWNTLKQNLAKKEKKKNIALSIIMCMSSTDEKLFNALYRQLLYAPKIAKQTFIEFYENTCGLPKTDNDVMFYQSFVNDFDQFIHKYANTGPSIPVAVGQTRYWKQDTNHESFIITEIKNRKGFEQCMENFNQETDSLYDLMCEIQYVNTNDRIQYKHYGDILSNSIIIEN